MRADAPKTPAPPPPVVNDDAADDAFAAARAAIAPASPPNADGTGSAFAPRVPMRDERKDNRWRTRNARRRLQGKAELTDDEQVELDRRAGLVPDASVTATPNAAPPVDAVRPPGKLTRVELENELAQLRALAKNRADADLEVAIGSTAGVVWDTVRKFTPRADRALLDDEKRQLGKLWAPILGPRLEAVAYAVPWVAAVAATYEIFAPRVAGAIVDDGTEPAAVIDLRTADASRGNETRAVKPTPTVEAAEGASGLVSPVIAGPVEAAEGGYSFPEGGEGASA